MTMRLTLAVALLLALTAAAGAQFQPGNYIATFDWIHAVSGTGVVTTVQATHASGGEMNGVTMDAENKRLVYGDWGPRGLFTVDPISGVRTTIVSDPNYLGSPWDLDLDQDGNLILAAWHTTAGWGLYRFSGGGFTTIITTQSIGFAGTFTGGVVRDVDNGHLVVQVRGATGTNPIYSIAPDGSSVTTVHAGIPLDIPGYHVTQSAASGHFLVGGLNTGSTTGHLLRIPKSGPTTTLAAIAHGSFAYFAPIADRASAASPRVISVGIGVRYHTDLTTGTVTSISLGSSVARPIGATILHSRNLQTVLTAPRQWDIRLSFPTQPSKVYALVAGLSGVRPGVTLGDGRRILINPDVFTFLTLVDGALPIFNDGGNRLDATGRATGKLDLTSLPPLGGLTLHMLAVVESSPGTLAVISDPYVMRLP